MKKIKVLHVGPEFWPETGGIENFMLNLCRQSVKQGISVEAAIFSEGKWKEKTEEIPGIGKIKLYWLGKKGLKQYFIPAGFLEAVKKSNPDIIHIHGIGSISDFAALTKPLHGKKIVVSTHGGFFHTNKSQLRKKIYYNLFCGFFLKQFDAVLACSRQDFENFSKFSKEKTILIENGVELLKQGMKKEKNVFLYAGRLSKNKRVDFLIKAFAEAKRKGAKFKLLIVGRDFDELRDGLESLAESEGVSENVFFEGNAGKKKLERCFKKSEFFASSSEFEGFGISAIEAMSAGCVCLLQENMSFRNFVKEGENGFLADFQETEKTAGKILQLNSMSAERKKKISEKAFAFSKKFSWEKKIREFMKVYRKVME